jgi:hypothetical protein
MPTNEFETLMRSIVQGVSQTSTERTGSITAPADGDREKADRRLNEVSAAEAIERVLRPLTAQSTPTREATVDAGRLAAELEQLRRVVTQSTTLTQTAGPGASRNTDSNEGSLAETVLKTVGVATGIGPLATGLMALFGRGSSTQEVIPAKLFEPPPAIAVEAGLTADRQFTRVNYGADGVSRTIANQESPRTPAMPPIQINVQAMDSRSFLDHSDDIARAVQQAMLHSHTLNDVVSEI